MIIMENNKRSRGCNYTPREKEMLLRIIDKHKYIIENKETNAIMANKKREVWEEIMNQHNAVATTGPRTWQQLRHLYENLKQRLKKKVKDEYSNQYVKTEKDDFYLINCNEEELLENNYTTVPSTSNTEINNAKEQTNKEETIGTTRKQYFKLKLKNAKIKNQYLINRNRMELNKYKLEMQILKLRLRKLQGRRK